MAKKFKYSKSGHKMVFDSDYKTWNKQCNAIGLGNFWADGWYGGTLRACSCTKNPQGEKRPKGAMLEFDLKPFNERSRLPKLIEMKILNLDKPLMLHMAYTYKPTFKPIGWILTDENRELIASYVKHQHGDTRMTRKHESVIDECLKYLFDNPKLGQSYYV